MGITHDVVAVAWEPQNRPLPLEGRAGVGVVCGSLTDPHPHSLKGGEANAFSGLRRPAGLWP